MELRREPFNENEEKTVKLDNVDISVRDFNKKLEGLKSNQRIIETSDYNFHLVERMQG